jgi:hypothetical protein
VTIADIDAITCEIDTPDDHCSLALDPVTERLPAIAD